MIAIAIIKLNNINKKNNGINIADKNSIGKIISNICIRISILIIKSLLVKNLVSFDIVAPFPRFCLSYYYTTINGNNQEISDFNILICIKQNH